MLDLGRDRSQSVGHNEAVVGAVVCQNTNFIVTVAWGIVVANDWPDRAESVAGAIILLSVLSGAVETVVNRAKEVKEEEEWEAQVRAPAPMDGHRKHCCLPSIHTTRTRI